MDFTAILFVVGLIAFAAGLQRIRRLERDVAELRAQITGAVPEIEREVAELRRPSARVVTAPPAPPEPEPELGDFATATDWAPPPPEQPPAPFRPAFSLESLIGGKLPIWVGGAALVVAGFFLVRLSIESGLFGPAARVAVAALFSLALIVAAELTRRLPAFRDDLRVGQALAGAGVASAYGTLYVAAAQYHLVSAAAAFAMMVAITGAALGLSLRYGPPTAIMALIGGFAAPLLAGSDAPEVGLLLGYLATFIAALFALAAYRGWRWLALAALASGFAWANLIVFLLSDGDATGAGAFVVALAVAGTLALPRTGPLTPWLRAAPLAAGLLQLLVLAPALDFGAVAWSFHLVLVAATLILAWRDPRLLPAAVIAAVLVTVLVALGLLAIDRSVTPAAAVIATLLLAGAGLAASRRARAWSAVALIGLAGPVLAAHIFWPSLLAPVSWTLIELLLAAAAAALAWRHRTRSGHRDLGLVGGTAVAALLAGTGLATLAGAGWAPLALVPVLLAAGWWTTRVEDTDIARLPVAVGIAVVVLAAAPLAAWIRLIGHSLAGETLTYVRLPTLAQVVRQVLLPAAAAAVLFAFPRAYGAQRPRVAAALAVMAAGLVYTLAKQPLAIADAPRFLTLGFVERAAITALFALAGWALATRTRFRRTGTALFGVALLRVVWFDLVMLSPVQVAQHVGGVPVLNAAVLLPALLAGIAWVSFADRRWRVIALLLTLLATAAAVRQVSHGTDLTGGLGNGENWGFSAAFLLLATVWLWRGLVAHNRLLRIAALALLTLVTLKVFLIDVAALGGVLRILSLLGLGLALIGIGWTYNRVIAKPHSSP